MTPHHVWWGGGEANINGYSELLPTQNVQHHATAKFFSALPLSCPLKKRQWCISCDFFWDFFFDLEKYLLFIGTSLLIFYLFQRHAYIYLSCLTQDQTGYHFRKISQFIVLAILLVSEPKHSKRTSFESIFITPFLKSTFEPIESGTLRSVHCVTRDLLFEYGAALNQNATEIGNEISQKLVLSSLKQEETGMDLNGGTLWVSQLKNSTNDCESAQFYSVYILLMLSQCIPKSIL